MEVRNRRGGITPAEGCMFGAVALFVILLLAILYIAFLRFRNPPAPTPTPVPAAAVAAPHGVFGWSEILPHGGQTSRAAPPQAASADV